MSNTAENIQLLLADILSFHEDLEKVFAMEKGIHDHGLLESAVHAPFQTFGGEDLYPDVYAKAARLNKKYRNYPVWPDSCGSLELFM